MRNTADHAPTAGIAAQPDGQSALGEPGATAGHREGPPDGTRRWPRARRILIPAFFIAPVLVYAVVFFAYPLVFGIIMSFQRFDFAAVIHGSGPFVGFANYRAVLSNSVTLLALRNTVVFTVASVVCQVVIGLAVALLLNRKFYLSGFLRRLVLVPWLIPLLATGTIFSLLFGTSNAPINDILQHAHAIHSPVPWLIQGNTALAAIILVNIWAGLPFISIVLYSGPQDIDPSLQEAAMVDGANPWQKLRYVTIHCCDLSYRSSSCSASSLPSKYSTSCGS